jgi:hypothetical protein
MEGIETGGVELGDIEMDGTSSSLIGQDSQDGQDGQDGQGSGLEDVGSRVSSRVSSRVGSRVRSRVELQFKALEPVLGAPDQEKLSSIKMSRL